MGREVSSINRSRFVMGRPMSAAVDESLYRDPGIQGTAFSYDRASQQYP